MSWQQAFLSLWQLSFQLSPGLSWLLLIELARYRCMPSSKCALTLLTNICWHRTLKGPEWQSRLNEMQQRGFKCVPGILLFFWNSFYAEKVENTCLLETQYHGTRVSKVIRDTNIFGTLPFKILLPPHKEQVLIRQFSPSKKGNVSSLQPLVLINSCSFFQAFSPNRILPRWTVLSSTFRWIKIKGN